MRTLAQEQKKRVVRNCQQWNNFLDDIDDFPIHLQAKLLRVLDFHELTRVGGTTSISINMRVVCASKIDLKELVERNLFRSDLYYRINVVPIIIPPLQNRKEDIPLLVNHFLQRYVPDRTISITDETMQLLTSYDWPGNIRELKNIVQRIAMFSNDVITPKNLPPEINSSNSFDSILKACNRCLVDEKMSFDEVMNCLEMNLLKQALQKSSNNQSQAAKILNLSTSTFRDKLKKYNLE